MICYWLLHPKSYATRDDDGLHGYHSVVKLLMSESCTSCHVGRGDVAVTSPAALQRAQEFEVAVINMHNNDDCGNFSWRSPSAGWTAAHSGGEKNPSAEEGRSEEVSENFETTLSEHLRTADVFSMSNIIRTGGKPISHFRS